MQDTPRGAANPVPVGWMDRMLHFLARFRARHIALIWLVVGGILTTPAARDSVWGRWFFSLPLSVVMILLLIFWARATHRYRGR